jgi:hypothetical protein
VVCEFKVAESVPLKGSISYQELAEKVGIPVLKLRPCKLNTDFIITHLLNISLKDR